MRMTRKQFELRFQIVQEKLPQIFLDVRNENIFDLIWSEAYGDQARIDEVQRWMNAEAQHRISKLSRQLGVPINFDAIVFDSSVDFNVKVKIEGHFYEELPAGTEPPA